MKYGPKVCGSFGTLFLTFDPSPYIWLLILNIKECTSLYMYKYMYAARGLDQFVLQEITQIPEKFCRRVWRPGLSKLGIPTVDGSEIRLTS